MCSEDNNEVASATGLRFLFEDQERGENPKVAWMEVGRKDITKLVEEEAAYRRKDWRR